MVHQVSEPPMDLQPLGASRFGTGFLRFRFGAPILPGFAFILGSSRRETSSCRQLIEVLGALAAQRALCRGRSENKSLGLVTLSFVPFPRQFTNPSRPAVIPPWTKRPFEQLNGTTFLRPQCRRCPARDRRRHVFARQRLGNPGEALGHVAHGWCWRLRAVALPDRTSPDGDRVFRKPTPRFCCCLSHARKAKSGSPILSAKFCAGNIASGFRSRRPRLEPVAGQDVQPDDVPHPIPRRRAADQVGVAHAPGRKDDRRYPRMGQAASERAKAPPPCVLVSFSSLV